MTNVVYVSDFIAILWSDNCQHLSMSTSFTKGNGQLELLLILFPKPKSRLHAYTRQAHCSHTTNKIVHS